MAKTREKSDETSAIDMLMEDHKQVQKMFRDFEKIDRDDTEACQQLVEQACTALKVHSMIEKEIFYPAIRDQAEDEQLESVLNEAEVEHGTVDELVEKLEGMDAADGMFSAHFTVLMEYVKHHIKEEEKEMFPQVKKMKSIDLDALGQELRERKDELMAEFGGAPGEEQEEDKGLQELDEEASSSVEDEQEEPAPNRVRR